MEKDWDKRAKVNARKYVALDGWKTQEEFEKSGLLDAKKVLQDVSTMENCVALEIGVGVGRVLKHTASHFKEVYAIDVSGEMLRIARVELRDINNVRFFQGNGNDLSNFPAGTFDFVYSVKVFQHIPREAFVNYINDIARVLKPEGMLKFQIFEKTKILSLIPWFWLRNLWNFHFKFWDIPPDKDSWIARSYSRDELAHMLQNRFNILKMENLSRREGDLWVTARVRKTAMEHCSSLMINPARAKRQL